MTDQAPVQQPPLQPSPVRPNAQATRETFWQNVVREMLMGLSVISLRRGRGLPPGRTERIDTPTGSIEAPTDDTAEMLDGRIAVLTAFGQRLPIVEVHPLFACSITSDESTRNLSGDVQCTVFRIRTTTGETFTLPLHEIRAVHALSGELVEHLEAVAQATQARAAKADQPFGFAAFTSTHRTQQDPYYPTA